VGLGTVEIILEVEETFGILLPECGLQEIRTVGELSDCVVETMGRNNEGEYTKSSVRRYNRQCPSEQVKCRLLRIPF
jgi:hypothetical protein